MTVSHTPKRIFLVGCPRSGTTLLQRCIASHPNIASFPETSFFAKAIGRGHGHLRAKLNRIKTHKRRAAFNYLARVLSQPEIEEIGERGLSLREAVDQFIEILDRRADGFPIWLEKTPKHFRYVEQIQCLVPYAQFIHVIRDGRDTVASIVDMARKYPGFKRNSTPKVAVRLWNDSVRTALRYRKEDNYTIVRYERLVEDPKRIMSDICAVLRIGYDQNMITNTDASTILRDKELWKVGVQEAINRKPSKFDHVFTDQERDWIDRHLDWRALRSLFPET